MIFPKNKCIISFITTKSQFERKDVKYSGRLCVINIIMCTFAPRKLIHGVRFSNSL